MRTAYLIHFSNRNMPLSPSPTSGRSSSPFSGSAESGWNRSIDPVPAECPASPQRHCPPVNLKPFPADDLEGFPFNGSLSYTNPYIFFWQYWVSREETIDPSASLPFRSAENHFHKIVVPEQPKVRLPEKYWSSSMKARMIIFFAKPLSAMREARQGDSFSSH